MKIDKIIKKIKNGELCIEAMDSGFFVYRSDGKDTESYSILPYDDDPQKDWYIISEGADRILTSEEVKMFETLCGY